MYRANPQDGIAWVTGASSGIGRGVALELARRGFVVAATARRAAELQSLTAEARGFSGKIVAFPGDVTDAAGMDELVARIEHEQAPIVLGFLNVGTYYPDPVDSFGGEGFQKTFALNVGGTAHCLGPLMRGMIARRRGQIAVNASLAGYGGLPQATAYGATKAALINLAESLKLMLDPKGVTMQVVNPGFVKTPLTDENTFPMPFLVPLDIAARRICDGFQRGGFEITFPRRLAWPMKLISLMPYPLYFWIVRRTTGGNPRQ